MKFYSLVRWISLFAAAPFITFIVAKVFLCKAPAHFCPWSTPFYYAAFVAVIAIMLHCLYKVRFNYFLLATNIWLMNSAALFLLNRPPLLQLMNNYKGPFLFCAFMVSTVVALLFSDGAFTRGNTISKIHNQKLTIFFLTGSILAFMWSYIFNNFGIMFSIVIPFTALAIFYLYLMNVITKKS